MDIRALWRGLTLRCPVCGSRKIFASYYTLHERCPNCDLLIEREDGYWLGAMVVAISMVLVVFTTVFVVGAWLTWPDVPWTGLMIGTVLLNTLIPIVGYPWCKTAWLGIHHALFPRERFEDHRPH